MKKINRIAVVIGHDKRSPGAWSPFLHKTEYVYNSEVASYLGGVADIYKRPLGGGYCTQMQKLANELNTKNYDLVIGLHFNCFDNESDGEGVGCESIIYPGNEYSRRIGNIFNSYVHERYGLVNRGVKEHGEGDRGWCFLSKINAPAIIFEPFFGDEAESLKFENEAEYGQLVKDVIKCA